MLETLRSIGVNDRLKRYYGDADAEQLWGFIESYWKDSERSFLAFLLGNDAGNALAGKFGSYDAAVYTKFFIDCIPSTGPEALQNLFTRLVSTEPVRFDTTILDELERRTVRDDNRLHPRVREGREFLRQQFRSFAHIDSGVLLAYGSLRFNDAVNLDADIAFALPYAVNPSGVYVIHRDLNTFADTLRELWGRYAINPESDVQLGISSPWLIDTFRVAISGSNGDRAALNALDVSIGLSGFPLFEEQREMYGTIQRELLSAVESEPLMTLLVNDTLTNCLAIRRERQDNSHRTW